MNDLLRIQHKMREAALASGMTYEQIGEAMGFFSSAARQSVSRLLNSKVDCDPRLSTVIDFARAINVDVKDLL